MTQHSYVGYICVFIKWSMYKSQVTPSWALQTTSGWADSYALMWNAVMGRALTTRVDSLRVGAAAKNV